MDAFPVGNAMLDGSHRACCGSVEISWFDLEGRPQQEVLRAATMRDVLRILGRPIPDDIVW